MTDFRFSCLWFLICYDLCAYTLFLVLSLCHFFPLPHRTAVLYLPTPARLLHYCVTFPYVYTCDRCYYYWCRRCRSLVCDLSLCLFPSLVGACSDVCACPVTLYLFLSLMADAWRACPSFCACTYPYLLLLLLLSSSSPSSSSLSSFSLWLIVNLRLLLLLLTRRMRQLQTSSAHSADANAVPRDRAADWIPSPSAIIATWVQAYFYFHGWRRQKNM